MRCAPPMKKSIWFGIVSAATGAEGTLRWPGARGGQIDAWWHAEQRAAALERSRAAAVGEEAEVADADQAFGKDMDQKAAQGLIGGDGAVLGKSATNTG